MNWYISYKVEGFPGTQFSGPYPIEDLGFQRQDIEGYEGVSGVRILSAEEYKEAIS
jgi:hypothetical protein